MHSETIEQQIIDIAAQVFEIKRATLSLNASRETIAEWDSLAHLKLLLELEEVFKVAFSLEEIKNCTSLKDIFHKITEEKK